MTIIITVLIILWLTVVAIIHQIYQLNRLIKRYNKRITFNFAQSYQNKQHIDSINKYIDNKAESVLDDDRIKALEDSLKCNVFIPDSAIIPEDRIVESIRALEDNMDIVLKNIKTIKDTVDRKDDNNIQEYVTDKLELYDRVLQKGLTKRFKALYEKNVYTNHTKRFKALEAKIKALEDNYLGINKVNDLQLSNKKAIKALEKDNRTHMKCFNGMESSHLKYLIDTTAKKVAKLQLDASDLTFLPVDEEDK